MSMTNTERVEELFRKYDKNGDGTMSRYEFAELFKAIDGKHWDARKADRLFNAADADRNNAISIQEFLNWVFRKPQGRAVAKAAAKKDDEEKAVARAKSAPPEGGTSPEPPPESDSEVSDTDSEGDGGDGDGVGDGGDGEEKKMRRSTTLTRSRSRKMTRPVFRKPVIDAQQFYEMITFEDGTVCGRLTLGMVMDMLAKCRAAGLGSELPRLVPQAVAHLATWEHDFEELTPFDVGHLYKWLTTTEPEAQGEGLERLKAALKVLEEKRTPHDEEWTCPADLGRIELDPDQSVGWGVFQDLLSLLGDLMLIDQDHLLACFLWARTGLFELTRAMAVRVMDALFAKDKRGEASKSAETGLGQPVTVNEFMHMCYVQQLVDKGGEQGMPHAQLSVFFVSTLHALPRLLAERDRRRGIKREKDQEKASRNRKSICGRVRLGLLFSELYKVLPPGMYESPLHMVLSLLEIADAERAPVQ